MAPVAVQDLFSHWRSPEANTGDLPGMMSPPLPTADVMHPSFLPTCEVGKDGGEMHSHAVDLLALAGGSTSNGNHSVTATALHGAEGTSVPNPSYLSSTRPPNGHGHPGSNSAAAHTPKARRMSSSTHGVLGRGKLGLTGDPNLGKDARPTLSTSMTTAAPIPVRRTSNAASIGLPAMFDFGKTDGRRPAPARSYSNRQVTVAASLPARGLAGGARPLNPPPVVQNDDMELDMSFDGDDDDDRSRSRSGSADLDMDLDEPGQGNKLDWDKLALGTGSGGIKGRRRGMVFKCETCSKEYRHPSCLIKHRWEHSPHWREPTQISMSKHQQVQMLEAAAILSHINPDSGRSLPGDKSLWPAALSPEPNHAVLRSAKSVTRDLPSIRSPRSHASPLSPGSFRDLSNVPITKDRKSSPASDSTSSMGHDASPHPNSLGLESSHARPLGISNHGRRTSVSSTGGPTTPASIGSLPDVGGLHFHVGSTPTTGASPLPNRALSLNARMRMPGGGMFGAQGTGGLFGPSSSRSASIRLPDSDIRGGRGGSAEDDELGRPHSSSEEAEERRRDEESFAVGEMEL
ncbi:hypothetical protein CcaverHIS002_0103510 [Cutaneotrichosporon cavernicola]|uniref:C2H2-type domain-containing protein n=1 Tax=Cutaneotrichosporon cavernicola TaxID=279322 RepID=A0AA48I1E1_9TREE|nr:uncharacterized protein CcaverHIS019_0103450 [Cutaneotrichosporon cavernicola]BEI79822.1 hypothetical protein CcaverHIS002_0103510 [Cutaneotrichosporon cavernicola]BEI87627.1 hypothetical protein CcaverHIS019_0103450 [Cutaneotrichosporon cavernicola]BEI95399.1 hypothetical protein CcaverHIS631_0103480 [Cutaneotrichosporon cavernicola]BEJ03173.1 hypothetical protein CcaverHIS641_0103480 [Cutaneotrichosporon cavernicola]